MALSKPNEYKEVSAKQNEETVYAEDINQIISNIEKLKGGQANEAPISNIKELKEHLDNLEQGAGSGGNIDNIPADKVSFNNDNANLDFSSKYDFPKFKNELKEIYEIKLITDYSINNVSHIDDVQDVYTLILEKNTDKYILKGNLNYNNTSQYTSSLNFYIISIDGNNDFGHIISEMFQFINSESNAKENEILIEGLNNFKYAFGFYYAIPIFQIKKQDNSNFEEKEYTINIEIQLNNIQNNQEFIPIACGTSGLSFLKLKNINGKAAIIGETIQTSTDSSFILFSHFALENYFDIKTDQNNSYYIEANNNITSNKNKSLKYYIRKEITDGSELSPIYANIPITFYYLEIKHSDDTDIEYKERLTFNLTAPKNADVPKIEKEANIQNAIEILSSQIKYLMLNLGIGSSKTYFEKTEIDMDAGGEVQHITAEALEDVSGLYLEKKYDGSYYIKGSLKISTSALEQAIFAVRVKAESLEKSKLRTMINDHLNGIIVYIIYKDNYIYCVFALQQISEDRYQKINEYKIYDQNILCPFDNDIITASGVIIEEPFGIYVVNGKYKLKGKISMESSLAYFQTMANEDIKLFFDNEYNNGDFMLQLGETQIGNTMITCGFISEGSNRICDIECPKQPSL